MPDKCQRYCHRRRLLTWLHFVNTVGCGRSLRLHRDFHVMMMIVIVISDELVIGALLGHIVNGFDWTGIGLVPVKRRTKIIVSIRSDFIRVLDLWRSLTYWIFIHFGQRKWICVRQFWMWCVCWRLWVSFRLFLIVGYFENIIQMIIVRRISIVHLTMMSMFPCDRPRCLGIRVVGKSHFVRMVIWIWYTKRATASARSVAGTVAQTW